MGWGKVRNQGAAGTVIVGKVTVGLRVGAAVVVIKPCVRTLHFILI